MIELRPATPGRPLRILCLGAHSDDIEIGCGGTILQWFRDFPQLDVTWVVFSAPAARATEARRSAQALLRGAASRRVILGEFEDAHFPAQFRELKEFCHRVAKDCSPDVVFTHWTEDRHQDHRLVGEVTWQTWRNQLILEYEIPKFEGDLGRPNAFVPLAQSVAHRKIRHLMTHFGTQRSKTWFRPSTFESMLQIRGIESRAESGFSEGFHARKLSLSQGR